MGWISLEIFTSIVNPGKTQSFVGGIGGILVRILFVHPVMGQSQTFSYGIGSLSAVLKAEGHETSLLKLADQRFDSVVKAIGSYNADLMAISCTSLHWELIKNFSQRVKGQFDVPIFVGGPHTTMFPE